ncbi:MAG: ubiquitin-like small modifier protein 1 [Halobacteriaceae archaeon]
MEWRLFADLAERAGTRRVTVDPGPDATVGDALEALFETHPELRDRVLENGRVVDHLTILHDGSPLGDAGLAEPADADAELAVFPPVSGG